MSEHLTIVSPAAGSIARTATGSVQLFDLSLEREVEVAKASANSETKVVGYGLIDPNSWTALGKRIRWAAPGPANGAFAAFGRLGTARGQWPVRVSFSRGRPSDVSGAEPDPFDEILEDKGILYRAFTPLPHDEYDPFPSIDGWRAHAPRDCYPLILPSSDILTLNADELSTIAFVLPAEDFDLLFQAVSTGLRTGAVSACYVFDDERQDASVEVSTIYLRDVSRTAMDEARRSWHKGMCFRQARLVWEPYLPVVPRWADSDLHLILRGALTRIAREDLHHRWSEDERDTFFSRALNDVRNWQLLETLLQSDQVSEEPELAREREKAQTVVGCVEIDPVIYTALGGPNAETLNYWLDESENWLALRSDAYARRVIHALLNAETGYYLLEADTPHVPPWASGVRSRTRFAHWDIVKRWRKKREASRRNLQLWLLAQFAVFVALGAVVGAWIAGGVGAKLGAVIGAWKGVTRRVARNELASEMQRTVLAATYPTTPWDEIHARMRKTAMLGAAWQPWAWRIVAEHRRSSTRQH